MVGLDLHTGLSPEKRTASLLSLEWDGSRNADLGSVRVVECFLGSGLVGRLMPVIFPQVPRNRRDGLPAHISSLAQRAYWALLSQRRDQSIVTLGRSGAGKTTCCEQVLEHLVGMAGSVDGRVSGIVVTR